ncbi:MAG: serine/threonine protein kinase [Deltaproteobacteria bacterium]|nr:serine/threonine protein kinase [Deltaproteobacteria bacterium]
MGRYRIVERLGRGGTGTVYRAIDPATGAPIAVKVIHPELVSMPEVGPTVLERVMREATTAGKLDHPAIVPVLGMGTDDEAGHVYLAMEFVDGPPLSKTLKQGKMEPSRALRILLPIADALALVHSRGIVHRDVKPGNIILASGDVPKLTDFGVAHLSGSEITRQHGPVGSPSYAAPEQIRRQPIDGRTDQFALGTVLWEMLAGRQAFGGDTIEARIHAVLTVLPPWLGSPDGAVPDDLAAVVARMMSKKPAERYPDDRALLADLKSVADALRRPAPARPA